MNKINSERADKGILLRPLYYLLKEHLVWYLIQSTKANIVLVFCVTVDDVATLHQVAALLSMHSTTTSSQISPIIVIHLKHKIIAKRPPSSCGQSIQKTFTQNVRINLELQIDNRAIHCGYSACWYDMLSLLYWLS